MSSPKTLNGSSDALSLAPTEGKRVGQSPGAYRKVEQWSDPAKGRSSRCDVIDATSPGAGPRGQGLLGFSAAVAEYSESGEE